MGSKGPRHCDGLCPLDDGVKGPKAHHSAFGCDGLCPLDAESSAIGCNAEFNDIKIILISVLKYPINGLHCLRLWLCCLLRCIHIEAGLVACF
jgi:hypothetical protein